MNEFGKLIGFRINLSIKRAFIGSFYVYKSIFFKLSYSDISPFSNISSC